MTHCVRHLVLLTSIVFSPHLYSSDLPPTSFADYIIPGAKLAPLAITTLRSLQKLLPASYQLKKLSSAYYAAKAQRDSAGMIRTEGEYYTFLSDLQQELVLNIGLSFVGTLGALCYEQIRYIIRAHYWKVYLLKHEEARSSQPATPQENIRKTSITSPPTAPPSRRGSLIQTDSPPPPLYSSRRPSVVTDDALTNFRFPPGTPTAKAPLIDYQSVPVKERPFGESRPYLYGGVLQGIAAHLGIPLVITAFGWCIARIYSL